MKNTQKSESEVYFEIGLRFRDLMLILQPTIFLIIGMQLYHYGNVGSYGHHEFYDRHHVYYDRDS